MLLIEAAELKAPLLAVIRWLEAKGSRLHTVGLERLGQKPNTVSFSSTIPAPYDTTHTLPFYGFVLSEPDLIICFGSAPQRYLDMQDGAYRYRIRTDSPLEHKASWSLIPFYRLTRTHQPEAKASVVA